MFIYDYRIPEDDEEDVDADTTDVSTSIAAMRDGMDKVEHGHSEL